MLTVVNFLFKHLPFGYIPRAEGKYGYIKLRTYYPPINKRSRQYMDYYFDDLGGLLLILLDVCDRVSSLFRY